MGNVHSKLCEYQRSYLFFDGRHNTEKAQEELAHLIYGADTNVIQPMTVRELIVFPAGENMLESWEPNLSSVRRRSSTKSTSVYRLLDLIGWVWAESYVRLAVNTILYESFRCDCAYDVE